jgi:flagellar hook-associated protein 2
MTSLSSVLSSGQITSLIQAAEAGYQAPATLLQDQEKPIETQISDLGKVQSALSSLQSAYSALANVQSLTERSVTTSSTGTVTASATNAATIGTYDLTKIHVASAESLVSSGYTSASGSLGSGSISIKVGSGSATTITIASGQGNLSGIAAAINAADVGVNASVVYDGAKYHLDLTAAATGTAGAFTLSGSGGLSSFHYYSGASGLTLSQPAANASFSLNGLTITSGSNTITGAVPGLTLTLAASGSATVTVSQNSSTLEQAASGVVSALNSVLTTISQYSSYSTASGAGPLLGDVGLQELRNDLVDAITAPATGLPPGTAYGSLSAIGFTLSSGGTVSLNQQTFATAAQSNYATVAGLLGAAGVATNSNVSVQEVGGAQAGSYAVNVTANSGGTITGTVNGQTASGTGGVLVVYGAGAAEGLSLQIAPGATGQLGTVSVTSGLYGTLKSVVGAALASGSGSVTGEISTLNGTVTTLNKQIAALQQEAQQQTSALTQEYSNAQATLSQLSTVSDFLSTYYSSSGSG